MTTTSLLRRDLSPPKERLAYTIGFLFWHPLPDKKQPRVLLVRKTHPDWQAGLWNGVGGKLDPNENHQDCIKREFFEETKIIVNNWERFCIESGPGYVCHCYRASLIDSAPPHTPLYNDVNEPLLWQMVSQLWQVPVVGNLRWMVPMALDWRRQLSTNSVGDDIRERPSW